MKYAKIKKDYTVYTRSGGHHFIKDELYTIGETNKLRQKLGLSPDEYDIVEIPKNKTAFIFGARFEVKEVK